MVVSLKANYDSKKSQTCCDPGDSQNAICKTFGGVEIRLYQKFVSLEEDYKLVDIHVSNYVIRSKIYVFTRFTSTSANHHMTHTYANIDGYKNRGLVEILASLFYCLFSWLVEIFTGQQSLENPNWFQGIVVDAVRWYSWLLEAHNVLECLILGRDQFPLMDFGKFIQTHRETDADILATSLSMDEKDATTFSVMIVDEEGRIIEMVEHLKGEQVKGMELDAPLLGIEEERGKEMLAIASKEKYDVSKYLMLKWLLDKFLGANEIDSEVILNELCQLLLLLILEVFDCSSDNFTERLDGELAILHSKGACITFWIVMRMIGKL